MSAPCMSLIVKDNTPMSSDDNLPPTQYLVMEVLAARYRLGESLWTFPSTCRPAIHRLAGIGYVRYKSGVTENTERVWLTPGGIAAWQLDSPYPPLASGGIVPQPNSLSMNLLHPERRGLFDGIAHLFSRRY